MGRNRIPCDRGDFWWKGHLERAVGEEEEKSTTKVNIIQFIPTENEEVGPLWGPCRTSPSFYVIEGGGQLLIAVTVDKRA